MNLVSELPASGPEVVVLCAHYDGHDLAESALDNGTGVAAVIRILEALAPHAASFRRTLRAILFTNEEWRLLGSKLYVEGLADEERRRIAMVVNLDTLAGSPRLACLTSEFAELEPFAVQAAAAHGCEIEIVRRLLANSDHYNFARHGVPAMRLVAGFDEPDARTRYLLTAGDRRDKVDAEEYRRATVVAAEMVWRALTQDGVMPAHKSGVVESI
jgi:Zn-dependent M28 family amino/carboxypeptidase